MRFGFCLFFTFLFLNIGPLHGIDVQGDDSESSMQFIHISDDGKSFVYSESKKTFRPWGFNYIGDFGRVVEEYWEDDWARVEKDFREMRKLGANVVRLHLQLPAYMSSPETVRQDQLELLGKVLELAKQNEIYLMLTGLNCFRLKDIPEWYDDLPEQQRWDVQARFWEAVARTCADHPAVFCYDLMNEPIIGKPKEGEHPWITGEIEGLCFVQRISNAPGKRKPKEIAEEWAKKMVQSIRQHDQEHLVTVGVIPWATLFPKAKPFFYTKETLRYLDFVSPHFYPKTGKVTEAVSALKVYDLGVPLVVGEIFPLTCSLEEMDEFIRESDGMVEGWIGHYFGRTIREHTEGATPGGELSARFLEYWKKNSERMSRSE